MKGFDVLIGDVLFWYNWPGFPDPGFPTTCDFDAERKRFILVTWKFFDYAFAAVRGQVEITNNSGHKTTQMLSLGAVAVLKMEEVRFS